MNVVIIEDDVNKADQLREFLKADGRVEGVEIKYSYNSGLSRLLEGRVDLVVLDMQLPTFDKSPKESGGRQRPFAGEELLRQMQRRKIPTKAIIVTQFEEFGDGDDKVSFESLADRVQQRLYPNYLGMIYYNVRLSGWKAELSSVVERMFAI